MELFQKKFFLDLREKTLKNILLRLSRTNLVSRPVHTNPGTFETAYFYLDESAFQSHETSESAHRTRIFLRPLCKVRVRGRRIRTFPFSSDSTYDTDTF